MKKVNTVCGQITPSDLGVTLMHEHIVFGNPGWTSDLTIAPINFEELLSNGLKWINDIKELGVKTFVNATPADCSRMPELLKAISEKTGVNIVCSTGLYYEDLGGSSYWKFRRNVGYEIEKEMYELFVKEITCGIENTGVRAGVIKVGTSSGFITEYEKAVLTAAAKAAKDTGVPIITHCQEGTMGVEQGELFLSEGVNPSNVLIGHLSDTLDPNYHEKIIKKGLTVGFDRMGLQGALECPLDSDRYPVIAELVKRGYEKGIVLSTDSCMTVLGRELDAYWENLPDNVPTHIFNKVIPELKKLGVTDEQINTIIVENPRRIFES